MLCSAFEAFFVLFLRKGCFFIDTELLQPLKENKITRKSIIRATTGIDYRVHQAHGKGLVGTRRSFRRRWPTANPRRQR
jgi:hypothetical protein